MPDSPTHQLHAQLTESQGRYCYFLLAAAASAIGLAIQQTQELGVAASQLPLALAVLSWGASFYFGCEYLSARESAMRANVGLAQLQDGTLPGIPRDPGRIRDVDGWIRAAHEGHASRSATHYRRQFRLLLSGAVFYLEWHLIEMVLRTSP